MEATSAAFSGVTGPTSPPSESATGGGGFRVLGRGWTCRDRKTVMAVTFEKIGGLIGAGDGWASAGDGAAASERRRRWGRPGFGGGDSGGWRRLGFPAQMGWARVWEVC